MLDRFVEAKMMFDCLVYFINRNMYAGVHRDVFVIMLAPDKQNYQFG